MEKDNHTVCSQDNVKGRTHVKVQKEKMFFARCDRLQTVYTRSSEAHTP